VPFGHSEFKGNVIIKPESILGVNEMVKFKHDKTYYFAIDLHTKLCLEYNLEHGASCINIAIMLRQCLKN